MNSKQKKDILDREDEYLFCFKQLFRVIPENFEVYIVDNTIDILKSICSEYKNCKFISYEKPNYGLAIKNGMIESKYNLIVIFDIDYFSKDFLETSLNLENKFSAIIASKRLDSSNDNRTFFRIFISSLEYSNL